GQIQASVAQPAALRSLPPQKLPVVLPPRRLAEPQIKAVRHQSLTARRPMALQKPAPPRARHDMVIPVERQGASPSTWQDPNSRPGSLVRQTRETLLSESHPRSKRLDRSDGRIRRLIWKAPGYLQVLARSDARKLRADRMETAVGLTAA